MIHRLAFLILMHFSSSGFADNLLPDFLPKGTKFKAKVSSPKRFLQNKRGRVYGNVTIPLHGKANFDLGYVDEYDQQELQHLLNDRIEIPNLLDDSWLAKLANNQTNKLANKYLGQFFKNPKEAVELVEAIRRNKRAERQFGKNDARVWMQKCFGWEDPTASGPVRGTEVISGIGATISSCECTTFSRSYDAGLNQQIRKSWRTGKKVVWTLPPGACGDSRQAKRTGKNPWGAKVRYNKKRDQKQFPQNTIR